MKTILHSFFAIIILSAFTACDQIDSDIIANFGKEIKNDTTNVDTTGGEDTIEVRERKVLVEDYTGHTCPNCPRAATELKTLEALYGEKIVAIALHVSTTFAEPQPPTYTADYRTTEGTEMDDFFNVSAAGLPKGMVNRKLIQGSRILPYQSWGGEIGNIINAPLDAWISMKNSFNTAQNKVTTDLKIDFENSINDEIKLCVFLVQDSIISPQKDLDSPTGKIIDYVHMHMLRKGLTSAFGESIITNPNASTPEITKSYSLVLSSDQIPEHCKIVAFIYKASNFEIIQVQEKHVK
ncbi:MAG TPA: Omp28-related outer membrane protein [Bacteroidia bacterium]|nr:Omp28-related outer membrane protein [Bacteroidia bacterium]